MKELELVSFWPSVDVMLVVVVLVNDAQLFVGKLLMVLPLASTYPALDPEPSPVFDAAAGVVALPVNITVFEVRSTMNTTEQEESPDGAAVTMAFEVIGSAWTNNESSHAAEASNNGRSSPLMVRDSE